MFWCLLGAFYYKNADNWKPEDDTILSDKLIKMVLKKNDLSAIGHVQPFRHHKLRCLPSQVIADTNAYRTQPNPPPPPKKKSHI